MKSAEGWDTADERDRHHYYRMGASLCGKASVVRHTKLFGDEVAATWKTCPQCVLKRARELQKVKGQKENRL